MYAQASTVKIIFAAQLAPAIDGPLSSVARGLVFTTQRSLRLPDLLPAHARIVLAGSADGRQQLLADDILRVRFLEARGQSYTFAHNFDSPDHQTVEPFGPVDLTSFLSGGLLQATVELVDTYPPRYSLAPVYLVILAPALPGSALTPDRRNAGLTTHGQTSHHTPFPPGVYALPVGNGIVGAIVLVLLALLVAMVVGGIIWHWVRRLLQAKLLQAKMLDTMDKDLW